MKSIQLTLFLFVAFASFSQEAIRSVKIGDQVWMADNLNVDHYLNGDSIPHVQDPVEWSKLTTGAWCYYENKTENGVKYGRLYNAFALLDPRGLAPDGWHIPTDKEWQKLAAYLGGEEGAGVKIRSTSGCDIKSSDIMKRKNGNNTSGFNGLAAGFRKKDGSFSLMGTAGCWWIFPPEWLQMRGNSTLEHYQASCFNDRLDLLNSERVNGLSVRCIKD